MATSVMHRGSVEFCSVLRRMLTACGHRPVIALAVVELMINVPVEMLRAMEPRPGSDEYST